MHKKKFACGTDNRLNKNLLQLISHIELCGYMNSYKIAESSSKIKNVVGNLGKK